MTTKQTYSATITHKGRIIATLKGNDAETLEARAHRYATNLNYHRAVVQVTPTQTQG
jgi:apolipoprotein N-acyltransferase